VFTHLNLHSWFSMMWGTAPVAALADRLIEAGQTVFPLTDRNGVYGLVEHLRVCEAKGLRPIIGSELVTADHRALCLVKTRTGYHNLNRMLTAMYHDPGWRLDEGLADHHEGLVVITLCDELIETLYPVADLYIDLAPGQIARAEALQARFGAPLVVNSHAYTISPKAHRLHLLLRAIDTNSKLSRLEPGSFEPETSYLVPHEEMRARFAAWPKALEATGEIAEACAFAPEIGKPIFPPSDFDEGYKTLCDKTYAGLNRRYERVTDEVRARADHELDMIRRKGFANCFLVIEDVVSKFSLTCGRGSAAASIVSYALGITHVEPIEHNLFFERFLNPGRVDPPDIDIDFAWDERDRVRDYLWQKHGRAHIAMVCNQNRLRPRSAIREIARVYGMGEKEMAEMKRALIRARKGGAPPDLREPWPEIMHLAKRLDDYPRQISVHCGGVVITPDEITNHCPLRPMPIGYDVIPWEKDGAEDYGFVKLDFLGNRSLAVIRDALAAVRENYGVPISYDRFNPIGDPRARALIECGDTMGCFYVESPATRQLLEKTRMGDFETLVAISSIIRPAANKIAAEWVRRHRWMAEPGRKPNWQVIHPELERVLEETHGLMVYQEDVTRTAMALAGFDAVMGDKLRKVLSKKDEAKLADFRQRFTEGCVANGLNGGQIDALWEMMASFAGYSFCKPHSASYALVSFKSAFLKAHYPAEFMAAVISNQGGYYSPFAYISEARRMRLQVLPPDINRSLAHYSGAGRQLRIGLMQVQGLSRAAVKALLEERDSAGDFTGFGDFLRRLRIDPSDARLLITAGCFDSLEGRERRPALLWELLARDHSGAAGQGTLFAEPAVALPQPPGYDERTLLNQERETLGLLASVHPLVLHRRVIARLNPVKACEMGRWVGRHVQMIGWWVTGKPVQDKNGRPMEFVSFEDLSGIYDATFFPDAYARFCQKLSRHRPYLLKGKVEEEFGVATLTVEWVGFLEEDRTLLAS